MLTAGRDRRLLVVAAALIAPGGRVLVQRRPADKQHGGLWEFPGGKVEPDEAPEAGLARELAEELGIAVAPAELTPAGFSTGPGIVLLLYACRVWRGVPAATEGAALRWVEAGALGGLAMPPADVPLVPVVRALLG